jgi:Fanconi-associated nuclease 1-like protein/VRR-NUC domain-containing protein/Fanconi anemia protein nuclease-like protein
VSNENLKPWNDESGNARRDATANSRVSAVAKARAPNGLPVLAPFYYLKNFELVLATLLARYSDLLSEEELRFIRDFPQLPLSSRALLTRMVMRRGNLFRASKLHYAELGETRAAAAPLIEAGWVSDRPLISIRHLHGLLTKDELIRCLKLPPRYVAWRKPELAVMLEAQFKEPRCFEDWYPLGHLVGYGGECVYALLIARVCERFRLMFFGNDRQSWTEFVTADLGVFRYENVEGALQSRPFQTRAQIEAFLKVQECRELLREGMPLDELMSIVPLAIEDSEWLEERRQKIKFLIAREYERGGESVKALAMYLQCNCRGARSRAIRLKAKAQDWEGARALCALAKENPESEAELQHVRRALPRIYRKLKAECQAEKRLPDIPGFEIVFHGTPRAGAVECQVMEHLARELADCSTVRYVENGLITALFGLLCWPAIFAPLPGAFFHDFHHGPADLESGNFYQRRKKEFYECLSHLDSDGYRKVIWRVFKEKWGMQSPFVRWHQLDEPLLSLALECFPAEHLRLWFEWIIRDTKENRAGFPDLVQFYPVQRKYRMIEVKGPGDRVQDNQRRLLEYCVLHGMPVSVCYVTWAG